jgi:hypothetical protein
MIALPDFSHSVNENGWQALFLRKHPHYSSLDEISDDEILSPGVEFVVAVGASTLLRLTGCANYDKYQR